MVAGSHSGDEKRQFWGHCGKDDELTVGTSRWKEDQSCGFSGIFDGRTNVVKPDPAWRSGGTTLQGHSTQQFTTAEPIRVDHSRRVELVLRLVARDGEKDLEFPKGECKPMSTLTPPPVQE
ncbi:unnamed protein product [Pocillopora meandrina]|uniref:Uncharacterized protein n=1 Tax=Pocillopora meandrina TaxID=46732 RepID=A0AAU9VX28_9CNID|nr:unnamed protein product [Pocillopora meandrina]